MRARAEGSTERRLLVSLAAVAVLLAGITAVSVGSLLRAFADARSVARSHEVIARLRSAHLCVAEISVDTATYLLTGRGAYLDPIDKTAAAARRHLERTRALVADDPAERGRVDDLIALVEARVRHALTLAALRRDRASEGEISAAVDGVNREMDAIHDAIGAILKAEEASIAAHTSSTLTAARAEAIAIAGVAAIVLVMLAAGYLLVRRDLALRRAAEAVLRQARDDAEAAGRELEAFSYSVAHDLRAPLRSIDGFSEALLDGAGPPGERAEHLRRIRKAARRMGQLIDDLLRLSRVARMPLQREPVDLGALATEVVAELRARQPDRAVDFAATAPLVVRGDARLLRVALENLLDNAWKFTGRRDGGAVVRVERVTPPGGEPAVCVRDNGAGFDMEQAGRLFAPFQRLHREQDFPGTGIGLAIVERVVRRHGGRIWAESAPGEGARFCFTLGD